MPPRGRRAQGVGIASTAFGALPIQPPRGRKHTRWRLANTTSPMPCPHATYACPSSIAHVPATTPLVSSPASNIICLAIATCRRQPSANARREDAHMHTSSSGPVLAGSQSAGQYCVARRLRMAYSPPHNLTRRPRSPRVQYCSGPMSTTLAAISALRRDRTGATDFQALFLATLSSGLLVPFAGSFGLVCSAFGRCVRSPASRRYRADLALVSP